MVERYDLDPEKVARWRGERTVNQVREVYFILGETTQLIKIGVANCAEQRLSNLRTGCSEPLMLLAVVLCPKRGDLERELHRRFAKHRVRGEWFSPAPEIITYIAENETPLEMLYIEHTRLAKELGIPTASEIHK